MEIEILARKALEILKSKWGMPERGFLAGGALANTIWELHSGNKAVVNDIDIFIFEEKISNLSAVNPEDSLYKFKQDEIEYHEDEYRGVFFDRKVTGFYTITSSEKKGIFNEILYKSSTEDQSIVLNSFDINATRVGYSIEKDQFYWTPDFEDFLITGKLKISNLQTPSHTAIRIAKKSKELGAELDELEFKIASYGIGTSGYGVFSDINKLRFKERYFEQYNQYSDMLKPYFEIFRDTETENYLKLNKNLETELYCLKNKFFKSDTDGNIFKDNNLLNIRTSGEFLFYIRNVYGTKLESAWQKIHCFFTDKDYIDMDPSESDLDILHRLARYAPKSIETLKGLKMSEQLAFIRKLLDIYKEDPIIAISILEKGNVALYSDLEDEQNQLLLELSVRKEIVQDSRNKVGNILGENKPFQYFSI